MPFDGTTSDVLELTPQMAALADQVSYLGLHHPAAGLVYALRCLEKTRATLSNRGNWAKYKPVSRSALFQRRQYCLVGALRHHHSDAVAKMFVTDAVHELYPVVEMHPCLEETLWHFNDRFWTRHRHVVAVLDHAIYKVREQLSTLGA